MSITFVSMLMVLPCLIQEATDELSYEQQLMVLQTGSAEQQVEVLTTISVDWMLERIKPDPQAVAVIKPLLKSPSADVRTSACDAFVRMGGKPVLVLPLCRDENSDVRTAAASSYLDGGGKPEDVEFLLEDSNPDVRGSTVLPFANAGGKSSVLLRLLKDESAPVRRWAAYCLTERGLLEEVIALVNDENQLVRQAVMRGLFEQDATSRYFKRAMESRYPDTRNAAAAQLLSRREISVGIALSHFMQQERENYRGLVASMDDQQRKDIRPTFNYWLTLDEPELHSMVKSALLSWGIPTMTEKDIRTQLTDPTPRNRIRALTALSRQPMDLQLFLPEIKAAMTRDETGVFVASVADIAMRQKRTKLIPLIRPFISRSWPEADSDFLRISIASAVGQLQPTDTQSVDILGELLESATESAPVEAVRALWRMDLGSSRTLRIAGRLKKAIVGAQTSFVISARQVMAEGGAELTPTLIEWLEEDDPELHDAVLDIARTQLRRYSPTEDEVASNQRLLKQVLPHAARLLGSNNENVRDHCFELLRFASKHHQPRDVGNPKLESIHVGRLASSSTDLIRRNVARLLGTYETEPAKYRRQLLEKLLKDPVPVVRAAGGLALARLPHTDHLELARSLLDILNGNDKDARKLVASQLADTQLDLKPVLPQLFEAMERGKVSGIPKLLAAVGDEAVAGLFDRLQHQKAFVREEAARALGEIGRAEFAKPIMELLKDDTTTCGGLEGLLKLKPSSYPPALAKDLVRIINTDVDPDEDPLALTAPDTDRKFAIRLLGRLGPAGSSAIALLAKQKYELTESYTLGTADEIPELSVQMAVALAKIEPTKDVGLMGFRKILTGVTTGRTWLYHDDTSEDTGYEMAIDAIVDLDERCRPLIPKLIEIAEPPGQLIHPGYRSLAAYALSKLEPSKADYWRKQGKRLRDRLPERDPARYAINERFGFE